MSLDVEDALWDWAWRAYVTPTVKDCLLALQDRFDANVPLILWAAFAAAQGISVSVEDARAACDKLAPLNAHTRALRETRRQLPVLAAGLPAPLTEAARHHVSAGELALERLELTKLAGLLPIVGPVSLEVNLAAALHAAGLDLDDREVQSQLTSLVDALKPHCCRTSS